MAWFGLMLEPVDYPSLVIAVSFPFEGLFRIFLLELDSCFA